MLKAKEAVSPDYFNFHACIKFALANFRPLQAPYHFTAFVTDTEQDGKGGTQLGDLYHMGNGRKRFTACLASAAATFRLGICILKFISGKP